MIVGCNALECKYINAETLTCGKDKIVISATIDCDNNVITECDDFERSEQ